MIDWSKIGPANAPSAAGPSTAPVAPATPGSIPTIQSLSGPTPQQQAPLQFGTGQMSPGEADLTPEQIDKLSVTDKIGHGFDQLGDFLFGEKSVLHGTPLPTIAGNIGGAISGAVQTSVVKPLEVGANLLNSVPLGGVSGADSAFRQLGDWSKANDPGLYQRWLAVDAASRGDVFKGGDLRADFNTEALKYIDDQKYNSALGTNPTLAIGGAGVGSLGQALGSAIGGWLGLLGNTSQKFLGDIGAFNPENGGASFEQMRAKYENPDAYTAAATPTDSAVYAFKKMDSGDWTEQQARDYIKQAGGHLSRVEESAQRLDQGGEVSDVEQKAIDAYRSGAWSLDHANTYIETHGQGITRNPIGQIAGAALTDPLTYATIGAGSIAKAGEVGLRIAEAGADATSTYEKLATVVSTVQQSQLGPAFRIARGLVDPLSIYKPSASERAVTDLMSGVAVESFNRAYGPAVGELRAIAREAGLTPEIDSAIASYSVDQARLMVARKAQRDMLAEGLGEDFVHSSVDDVIDPMTHNAGADALTELTDHMASTAKNTFTPEEDATLAGRLAATFGKDVSYWEKELPGMSNDLKSALHAITYKRAEVDFEGARATMDASAYSGDLPLRNMVLMTSDTLDNQTAESVIANIRDVLKSDESGRIASATNEWNALSRRYPSMATIGYASGGKQQLEALVKELEKKLQSGGIARRATEDELSDPVMSPIKNFLDRNSAPAHPSAGGRAIQDAYDAGNIAEGQRLNIEEGVARGGTAESGGAIKASAAETTAPTTRPLWKVGFRPDEEVAWGLKRDASTGRYVVDRDPTISHVVDAVPGRQPFSDTTRNALGQIIGKSTAERVNKPIESIEAMTNTMRDGVTGRRMVMNVEKRFERSTFNAGFPKPLSKEIFAKAREVAGLDHTTVRGIKPGNLWNSIHDIIPRDLVLADGTRPNIHIVMDHLLRASEGDLRIMGVSSALTQRVRSRLFQLGDGSNMAGQMTVSLYNKLRYAFNPTFIIQRVSDAPYFSILYGITPVGRGALTGAKAELQAITENLGRTGLARDFSMDMPEYATRSNFTAGIKSSMQEAGLKDNKLQRILEAPDTIIANNMTNMLHAQLGKIVRGVVDNLASAAEKADPSFQADMLAAGEQFQRTFADWRRVYSEEAGRVLDDNEVGLQYIKDQLNAWRRHVVNADGTLDFSRLIAEGERSLPNEIADIGTIRPDVLAQELGYADSNALRRDVTGHIEKINGEFTLVNGEHDVPWLEEQLRDTLHAHPDYVRRASAYYGETWDDFWTRLSRGVDQGGLDISPHYAKEAQDLIAATARQRGMDPWEYLSGVMASNVGATDLETHMGQLVSFLKAGKAKQPLEEWTKMFRATLDPSAQAKLLQEFEKFESAVPVEDVLPNVRTPGTFAKDAKGNAVMPAGYKAEPGYVYRIDTLDKMRGGMRKGEGVSTDANPIYASGRPGEGVFRAKATDPSVDAALARVKPQKAGNPYMQGATKTDEVFNSIAGPNGIPQKGKPGLFVRPEPQGGAAWYHVGYYDDNGNLVAQASINAAPTGAGKAGVYAVSVKPSRARQGWATKMYDALNTDPRFDMPNLIGTTNGFSPEGKAFAESWLTKQKGVEVGPGRNAAAQPGGKDRLTKAAVPPEDIEMLGPDGTWTSLGADPMTKIMGKDFPEAVRQRVISGVPHPDPEIEGYMEALSKWVKETIGPELGGRTRADLRRLVEAVPTSQATSFNRSQALVTSLLKNKIEAAQRDIFRLAEMQTKRSVLERSLNHPLFGLYPASYMWGKVLPETVKFLARNPYAATYVIADVERAIAIQREYDSDMESKMNTVDRSSAAFLLDYLTPGLPWSDHAARLSPMVRDLFKGAPANIWSDELDTVSPMRWVKQFAATTKEGADFLSSQGGGAAPANPLPGLQSVVNAAAPGAVAPSSSAQITGPTKGSGLGPILSDDLTRLSSILLEGGSPER